MMRRAVTGAWLLLACALHPPAAASSPPGPPAASEPPGVSQTPAASEIPAAADALSAPLRVGFDQNLGAQIPLDLVFRDEDGDAVRLGDLFTGTPVILSFAYYECPMLCGLSLQGLASSLKTLSFDAGKEFRIITVSFNPKETPAQARLKKARSLDLYGRPGAASGWRFLTGEEEPIRRLTAAAGFRYAWDDEEKQYAHPTGIIVLTPSGRIARYFFGVEYAPRDLRLGIIEAAEGRIGTLADRLLLLCYRYDPKTGRYSGLTLGMVRAAGVVTVLVLCAGIVISVRREKRRAAGRDAARRAGL